MNCREFESILADELGGELSQRDRSAFASHLAECAACRAEHEAHRATLERLRESVPGPIRATMNQEDGRVVITTGQDASNHKASGIRIPTALMRYAAVILLSFAAGYLARAWDDPKTSNVDHETVLAESDDRLDSPSPTMDGDNQKGESIREAVLVAHRRNPSRSNASKFIAAMFAERH